MANYPPPTGIENVPPEHHRADVAAPMVNSLLTQGFYEALIYCHKDTGEIEVRPTSPKLHKSPYFNGFTRFNLKDWYVEFILTH